MKEVQNKLFNLRDEKYKQFHAKLIPTVEPDCIIGIRTPVLREFANQFYKTPQAEIFMNELPHKYYEENNLHAFLLEKITDYNKLIAELNKFLPFVNNWATCDMMRPKTFKKHTDMLLCEIKKWIKSKHPYTVRFGIEMLMIYYLGDKFSPEFSQMVAEIKSDEYYVNMMIAWYFATALAKQYKATLPYLAEKRLDIWVHNKTIQKAIESYRITDEQKNELKALKIKTAR